MVASDHDLGSWILGQDQRDLALARVHAALEEHAEDGKVGFGLNDVRYLGGSELKHLENRNRNGVKGWFVSQAYSLFVRVTEWLPQSACDENSPARGRDRVMENRIREIEGLPPLPEPASEPSLESFHFTHLMRFHYSSCFRQGRPTRL